MKPGLKLHQGHPAGLDPREMSPQELRAAGHEPMSPLQAMRARCLDCCGGQVNEVAICPVVECPAWPFRMATNPWRKPASEARREAARRSMEKINAGRRKRNGAETAAGRPNRGTTPLSTAGSEVAPMWATGGAELLPDTGWHREGGVGGSAGEETSGFAPPAPRKAPDGRLS
jgi:hypothetical protein